MLYLLVGILHRSATLVEAELRVPGPCEESLQRFLAHVTRLRIPTLGLAQETLLSAVQAYDGASQRPAVFGQAQSSDVIEILSSAMGHNMQVVRSLNICIHRCLSSEAMRNRIGRRCRVASRDAVGDSAGQVIAASTVQRCDG